MSFNQQTVGASHAERPAFGSPVQRSRLEPREVIDEAGMVHAVRDGGSAPPKLFRSLEGPRSTKCQRPVSFSGPAGKRTRLDPSCQTQRWSQSARTSPAGPHEPAGVHRDPPRPSAAGIPPASSRRDSRSPSGRNLLSTLLAPLGPSAARAARGASRGRTEGRTVSGGGYSAPIFRARSPRRGTLLRCPQARVLSRHNGDKA